MTCCFIKYSLFDNPPKWLQKNMQHNLTVVTK
jgi:hypothetical protein